MRRLKILRRSPNQTEIPDESSLKVIVEGEDLTVVCTEQEDTRKRGVHSVECVGDTEGREAGRRRSEARCRESSESIRPRGRRRATTKGGKSEKSKQAPKGSKEVPLFKKHRNRKPASPDKHAAQAEEGESELGEAEEHEYGRSAFIVYYNKCTEIEKRNSKWKNLVRVRLASEEFTDHRRCVMIGEERCQMLLDHHTEKKILHNVGRPVLSTKIKKTQNRKGISI